MAAASTLVIAASCRGRLACMLAAMLAGLAPLAAGRRWASGPLALLVVLVASLSAGVRVESSLAALGSLVYAASLVEGWDRLVARELALPALLAGYAGFYVWLFYTRLPASLDLPAMTREAFSEPESRVVVSLIVGAYLALAGYYLFSTSRRSPKLLGPHGLVRRLRWHRLAPLWLPLIYVVAMAPASATAFSVIAMLIAAMAVYERAENPDASLVAAVATAVVVLKLAGA